MYQMSDSLSNLFSHIQNGQRNRILVIETVKSKLVIAILNILQEHGYIRGYRLFQHQPSPLPPTPWCCRKAPTKVDFELNVLNRSSSNGRVQILLKYKNEKPAINRIIRISKPSKRIYVSKDQLFKNVSQGWNNRKKNRKGVANGAASFTAKAKASDIRIQRDLFCFMEGIIILSTPKGVLDSITAHQLNVGGEIICHVY